MSKHHSYKNIIERKLEQLTTTDTGLLWNDMHSILDKKMPQKKEKRRFMVWTLSSEGILLLTIGLFFLICSSLFLVSTNESSAVTIKELPSAQQPNQLIENDFTKVSKEPDENITTINEADEKARSHIPVTTAPATSFEKVTVNNSIAKETIKRSKKYATTDQSNQPINDIPEVIENFEIASIKLESIHHSLIESNHSEEKKYFNPQPKPTPVRAKLNTRNNDEKGLYAGVMFGVDISSVHFQSAKSGGTAGFIIGYTFNKRWSIESGLLWDTKRVYDNGSYFNPPGYTPTNGITIIAVNGKSRLYELPVNMKYTIISGKQNLFATTGMSSYLMRTENYDYEYMQNSQPGGHNYLSYAKETKNWFSVANFSIGYTHKLGSNGSFRIEPYLKLPLKDIGTANMPIMSTGFNIGFTKPLRR